MMPATRRIFNVLNWQYINTRVDFWKGLFAVNILVCYLYILMEWVFFVTMPSFMSLMGFSEKAEIYLVSGLGASLISLAALASFIILELVAFAARFSKFTPYLGILLPAIILSSLALQLFDNFTYTVFKFGISNTSGILRGVYAALFILLLAYIYLRMLRFFGLIGKEVHNRRLFNRLFIGSLCILVASFGISLIQLDFSNLNPSKTAADASQASRLPNILLLGSDGLNAQNLSAYGYYRNTTPQLAELAKISLVAENAFTNAGNTTGSVISIMTSKLPTQTRVLYPPNILTGLDAYQHLPGILKNLGYKTAEYGVPFYIDAYNYNLQNGFDIVNDRTLNVGKLGELGRKLGYDNEVYFLYRIIWRISDRLLHIFFIRTMQNPFNIVTEPVLDISDIDKVDQLLDLFEKTNAPLFVHAHLLGTHGGYYEPPDQLFSIGKSQTQLWMNDFYDDTLRAFDAYVGEVIARLKQLGKFDNTIIIIYTDHNKQFKVTERVPLIIHFPGDEYAGPITSNVENMDIAPTILDYLGMPQPNWMNGESLLISDLLSQRLIFSTGTTETKPNENDVAFIDPAVDTPPFYQFSYINVVDCQKWYSLNLETLDFTTGDVTGYVNPCKADDLRSPDEIKEAIYDRLKMDGFDISSLP